MLNIKNIYKIIKNKTFTYLENILSSLSYKFVYCKKKKNEKKLQERIP